jgi:hypothetical protein
MVEHLILALQVLQDKRFKNRELQIMQLLEHPNIIKHKHCFYSTTEKDEVSQLQGAFIQL